MNNLNMQGYLIKISKGRWATINNKRYFALKVNGRFLVYYDKEPTEIKHIPKKVIPTESIISVDKIDSKDNKKFSIKTKETTYLLKAYNKETREKWFNTLSAVVNQSKKEKEKRNFSASKIKRSLRSDQEFLSRPRSQNFTTTDPKMSLSILMKIQTDTKSSYESNRTKASTGVEKFKTQKKNIFNSVINNDLLINEEYKKIDIAEDNFQIFECEISKIKYQPQELTKIFGISMIKK
jgi:hypothetical protein